jgi:hypothetical protein
MPSAAKFVDAPSKSFGKTHAGVTISSFVIAFLMLDSVLKLFAPAVVADTMSALGWPADQGSARVLGLLLLASTALYAVPRTAVLGAILLTAYLGGAVATHVRVASPLLTHVMFGVYVGVALWGGLFLRNSTLRSLLTGAQTRGTI